MSLHPIDTFSYDPVLFGHPHDQAEPQPTEPFITQYPDWVRRDDEPTFNHYYQPFIFPQLNNNTMNGHFLDTAPVVIGSGSRNNRGAPSNRNTSNARNHNSNRPRGIIIVDVYSRNAFVGKMPLTLLIRFSHVAAAAFPKPQNPKSTASSEAQRGETDVEKLTAGVKKLSTNDTNGAQQDSSQDKRLDLDNPAFWDQPGKHAFDFVFAWMHQAKTARPNENPLDLCVPNIDAPGITVQKLVDYYAAAMLLGVRPEFHKLRFNVMAKITGAPPRLADIQHVHEYLPIDDVVMTRTITSFFQHDDRNRYSVPDRQAIVHYVITEDQELNHRFGDISQHRKEHKDEIDRQRAQSRLQRLAERGASAASNQAQGDQGQSTQAQGRQTQNSRTQSSQAQSSQAQSSQAQSSQTQGSRAQGSASGPTNQEQREVQTPVTAEAAETVSPPPVTPSGRNGVKLQKGTSPQGKKVPGAD